MVAGNKSESKKPKKMEQHAQLLPQITRRGKGEERNNPGMIFDGDDP